MYSNYELANNPSFKMKSEDFNELLNTVAVKPTGINPKEVKISLVVRTRNTNLIAKDNFNSVLFTKPMKPFGELEGAFNLVANFQYLVTLHFGNISKECISRTVFMPIGAYDIEGSRYIYCNLIIDDEDVEVFNTNESINFVPIDENLLNNIEDKSIIILPTLTIVNT